ncbi:peptidase metallopeptidase [Halothece sp. PCC 7418]|uniref:peptidase n=1 Tax=Halothece sp. (strain PCC 7418) TaxID=65093 RepID=UPI0002A07E7C|nr:peptidase [Halothece sp. PCC 7418]AFZ42519.1 peptidase metallopeptidase [Halothece sp. PCC 7418]
MKLKVAYIFLLTIVVIVAISKVTVSQPSSSLPPLKAHPLPPTLAQWETVAEVGDYFSEVEATPLGYLVWSEFPVKVYLDLSESARDQGVQGWVEAVTTAIEEWAVYLPLEPVNDRAQADIIIARSRPPLNTTRNPETGLMEFSRDRTARTRYQFKVANDQLIHGIIIEISPHQRQAATLATARHEMGHALGIWGHSPHSEDALYFSQVRDFPSISARDINTLKKIYQQPTRLGWKINFAN